MNNMTSSKLEKENLTEPKQTKSNACLHLGDYWRAIRS